MVIATPSAAHADQSIAALNAGKAVFCQKPLGRTGPEVAEVVAAARRADRLLGVDLSYRHTAAMAAIRPLLPEAATSAGSRTSTNSASPSAKASSGAMARTSALA